MMKTFSLNDEQVASLILINKFTNLMLVEAEQLEVRAREIRDAADKELKAITGPLAKSLNIGDNIPADANFNAEQRSLVCTVEATDDEIDAERKKVNGNS